MPTSSELEIQIADQQAESFVLGALLIEPETVELAAGSLREDDFLLQAHRKIFRAILTLAGRGIGVDPATLCDQLKKDGCLEEVGGLHALHDLGNTVISAAHLDHHCRIVRDRAIQRRLLEAAAEITRQASEPVEDVPALLDKAETLIQQVRGRSTTGGYQSAQALVNDLVSELKRRSQGTVPGLRTGFRDLDRLTGGLHGGELVILAGRPSMGKTALALSIALQVAGRPVGGCPVGFFSLEMGKGQIIQRLTAMISGLDSGLFRSGKPNDQDWLLITKAASRLYNVAVYVDDTPGISALELRARARRLLKQEHIGLVIVDYLQLMASPDKRGQTREQEVSLISRQLKALARELCIPILALSQLNRSVESRTDQRPRLCDLRESGAIEQDADLVMFVFRPEQAGVEATTSDKSTAGQALLLLEKNRNGPTGTISLRFERHSTLFTGPGR